MSVKNDDSTSNVFEAREKPHSYFQDVYIALRNSEKRLYTDEEVLHLPEVNNTNIYKKEWSIRKASCKRLVNYLGNKKTSLKILEVGCGNGWLSHQLSSIKYSDVVGLDINDLELDQALRVFAHQENLRFIYGNIMFGSLQSEKFDVIVFAASVQYFQSLSEIINTALSFLNKEGEVHIMDTHFYQQAEVEDAKQRSIAYFREMGFENMGQLYFHHTFKDLQEFKFDLLYDPTSFPNKLLNRKDPFYWIRIKNKE